MNPPVENPTLRLDKWLWRARFFKSRSLASRTCDAGKIRVGGRIVRKAHYPVRVGDVLTIPAAGTVQVVRVESLGTRRGPSVEARSLYLSVDGAS